jgi:hypothetical protein
MVCGEEVFAFRGRVLNDCGVRGYGWGPKVLHDEIPVSRQAELQFCRSGTAASDDLARTARRVRAGAWIAGLGEFSKNKAGAAKARGGNWTNGIYVHHGAAFFNHFFWPLWVFLGGRAGDDAWMTKFKL